MKIITKTTQVVEAGDLIEFRGAKYFIAYDTHSDKPWILISIVNFEVEEEFTHYKDFANDCILVGKKNKITLIVEG